MQEDTLLLTTEERDRLKVLHEVQQGHITQQRAAEQLKLSTRQVRRLLRRLKRKGDRGVIHALRGKPSNRKIANKTEQRAIGLVQRKYYDFGPTLAAEYLAKEDGLVVSRETLRHWMIEAGIWKSRRQRIQEVHVWRQRRDCFGELLQWDMSDHDWLEGRGEKIYYVALIDDATSGVFARFVRHDSREENLKLLGEYLARYGRPLEVYTDRDTIFAVSNGEAARAAREGWGEAPKTQFRRALEELAIGWIGARSPEAKGRVERHFQTAQDRLVKGMRLAGVNTLEAANRYLEQEFVPLWNERFTVEPANATDAHRPLRAEHNLAAILGEVQQRVVTNDYTIRLAGKLYQIARPDVVAGLRKATVRVEKRLDGTVAVRFRDRYLTISLCEPRPHPQPGAAAKTGPRRKSGGRYHDWNKDFDLHKAMPVWVAGQASGARKDGEC